MANSNNKFTATDLKMMQAEPLDVKILKTKQRIREYYNYFDGQVYVSFSGGKDSTVLLHIIRQLYPEVPAIFVDTGLEYPEVKEFVKTWDNVEIVRPPKTFRQVIEQFGYPLVSKKIAGYVATAKRNPDSARAKFLRGDLDSKIFGFGEGKWYYLVDAPFKVSDYCCDVMKKQPGHKYQRETGRHPIIGTLAEESIMPTLFGIFLIFSVLGSLPCWNAIPVNICDFTVISGRSFFVSSSDDNQSRLFMGSISVYTLYGYIKRSPSKFSVIGFLLRRSIRDLRFLFLRSVIFRLVSRLPLSSFDSP